MLTRWRYCNPRFFEDTNPFYRQVTDFGPSAVHAGSYPPFNVYDDGESIVVRSEAPGLAPEAIEVTATARSLTIKGERRKETTAENKHYHRRERRDGFFNRSLTLPQEVDPDKVRANYTNGILEVVLPKAERAKPKKITVNA